MDLSHVAQCRQARGVENETNSDIHGLMTNTQLGRSDVGKEMTLLHCTMENGDADDLINLKIQAFLKV